MKQVTVSQDGVNGICDMLAECLNELQVLKKLPREPIALTPYAPLARGQEPGWECFVPGMLVSGYGTTILEAMMQAIAKIEALPQSNNTPITG